MWSSRLFWKLFVVYAGLTLSLTVGLLWVVSRWQNDFVTDEADRRLREAATMMSDAIADRFDESEGEQMQRTLQAMAGETNIRYTIILSDGTVVGDSEHAPTEMENHGSRPEVREAMAKGVGTSHRYSSTLRQQMVYVAVPLIVDSEQVGFVRTASSVEARAARASDIYQLVWAVAIVFGLLAIGITYFLVGRMIHPLSELLECSRAVSRGDYTRHVNILSRDEFGMLALAFNQMQQTLANQVQNLEENSERLETVLGSMREGVLAVDNQQRVLFANQASRAMLEIRPDAIEGRPLVEATPMRPVQEAVNQVLQASTTLETEFETNGQPQRIVTMRANPLPGGPTPGVMLVIHDVSELRRLENLRREFVANVSHELKTPLSSIKAYAETLRMGAINDPDNNLDFVGRIEEQGERLHQLIVDLLHIARMESGQQAMDIGPVPVARIVDRIEPYFRRAAEEKQLVLQVEPSTEALVVMADDEGLRTILDNLVMNAIRYTPEEGSVTVRWRRDNSHCVIEVEDTGIGIAESDQARIFERFYRIDKARSRELGGTGLGLAIVKHLAHAFNGTIAVESELNRGSTFVLRLPLAEDQPNRLASTEETPVNESRIDR